ncbi:MAG: envelope stress response membrane protein PspB [Pseudomonadota bacterium]
MDEGVIAIVICAILFVGMPGIVFHYITEWRKMKTPTADDERLVDDLWRTAQRLERRVETLERILDKEAPDWRASDEDKEYRDADYRPAPAYRGGGDA